MKMKKKVFLLLEDILTELKKISEYISYLKWEEMCRREIHTKLPKDKPDYILQLDNRQMKQYGLSLENSMDILVA